MTSIQFVDPDLVIKKITMTSRERIQGLHWAIEQIHGDQIPGDVVECGVWRGGNIVLARRAFDSVNNIKHYWAYDTFDGMTQPGQQDPPEAHTNWQTSPHVVCRSPRQEVEDVFRAWQILDQRTHLIQGDVAQTLQIESNLPDRISLLRLDTDWYASTLIELERLYPRLESGGYLIIDDYGYWSGCRQAVHEYFGADLIRYGFVALDDTGIMYRKP